MKHAFSLMNAEEKNTIHYNKIKNKPNKIDFVNVLCKVCNQKSAIVILLV